jgi:hypothetical protein
MPSAMVMTRPPRSFPGMMSFAKAPATSPMMRVQMSDVAPPDCCPRAGFDKPRGHRDERALHLRRK